MKPLVIAPSILSADFGCLAREVQAVDAAGADHTRPLLPALGHEIANRLLRP